ncbi:hypothetical protein DSM112329_01545 [Paraconexibacter sp. AEG42_29]|uniref:AbiEi antitoxin N-terminal domain-containing protein n=1 Tax=Paraconexibacter sp. AEG42_29 TaxID=2997339 RepID=A0AAU7ASY9_9ACTN
MRTRQPTTDDVWFPPGFDRIAQPLPTTGAARRTMRTVDPVIVALAERQHGAVARSQLLALGVSDDHIAARLASGMLVAIHPGVYRLGGGALPPDQLRMAAVLACRRGSRLAGWTGATHRDVLPDAGTRPDVAVPPHRRPDTRRFQVVRAIPVPDEQTLVRGVPTHTVARILLDLARRDDGGRVLEWAWRQAIYKQLLDVAAVRRLLLDRHGQRGVPALQALYDRRAALVGEVRNEFELLMLEIIRAAGLPEPRCNEPWDVGDGLVLRPDFRIPELLLVVESDGKDGHADVEFLLSDAERDARYAAMGYATLRYSKWETTRQRGRVDDELRRHRELFLRTRS